jgi:hypothetical protein
MRELCYAYLSSVITSVSDSSSTQGTNELRELGSFIENALTGPHETSMTW